MIGIECTLDDFKDALEALNDKLKNHHITIEIRAIGGFAMLYNKLRSGGYTMDVDTATRDMTEEVQELIREVAEEKGLDEDWINNDSYGLPEVTEIIGKLEWITDNSYSNIMLYIAKIESLLLLKVRAVHFAGLVPRITDQTDVLDILAFLGIHTIEEVKQNPLTKSFEKKYPRCFEFLKNTEKC
ncbi:MAG: hypothetical protein K5879_08480 [Lachnospiraceae bacterium]|nr:hypothetical protein [Lachnospiraceae bacterium]